MRPYIVLIFVAIILAFFSGRYVLEFHGSNAASNQDILEIARTKLAFQKEVTPYAIVNFSSLYYSSDQVQLMNPSLVIEEVDESNYTTGKHCNVTDILQSSASSSTKKLLWDQLRCGKIKSVPLWFLKESPYLHPSGASYAYLLFLQQRINGNRNWAWVRDNLSFFHITELRKLQRELGPLGGIYGVLAGLDEKSLIDLSNQEGTILTHHFLLAKIKYPKNYPILEYRFYIRDELENFLHKSHYNISNYRKGKSCLLKDGPLCWNYNARHMFELMSFSTLISFSGVLTIFIFVLYLLFTKIKSDRVNQERRKMALQVLTHEFRTPVTSLLLMMEKFHKKMDRLDSDTQEDILRLSQEIYRLQRLTEKSKHYLQRHEGNKLFKFMEDSVTQIEDIVLDVIMPIEEARDTTVIYNVHQSAKVHKPFKLDIYWFQIIVKNLIENAFNHGKPPVEVIVLIKGKNLFLKVKDNGSVNKTLCELTQEFNKGTKSTGSGLGMAIVHKVIKDMGGKLSLDKSPTTFTVSIPIKE